MEFFGRRSRIAEEAKKRAMRESLDAKDKSIVTMELTLDGKIITVNPNYLNILSYTLEEVQGQHHRIFVDSVYRESPEYHCFWERLGRGEYNSAKYKRIGKDGIEVWIQAAYNPVMDANGKPFKVLKFALDVTNLMKASQAQNATAEESQIDDATAKGGAHTHHV